MSGHTPGPWHTAGEHGEFVNDPREMNICRVNPTVRVRSDNKTRSGGVWSHQPNARLIAAAPELYEEARILVDLWSKLEDDATSDPEVDEINAALDITVRELGEVLRKVEATE